MKRCSLLGGKKVSIPDKQRLFVSAGLPWTSLDKIQMLQKQTTTVSLSSSSSTVFRWLNFCHHCSEDECVEIRYIRLLVFPSTKRVWGFFAGLSWVGSGPRASLRDTSKITADHNMARIPLILGSPKKDEKPTPRMLYYGPSSRIQYTPWPKIYIYNSIRSKVGRTNEHNTTFDSRPAASAPVLDGALTCQVRFSEPAGVFFLSFSLSISRHKISHHTTSTATYHLHYPHGPSPRQQKIQEATYNATLLLPL